MEWLGDGIDLWLPALLATFSALLVMWVRNKVEARREEIEKKNEQHRDYVEEAEVLTEMNVQLRDELRAQAAALKGEVHRIESELDEWKIKYFKLYEDFIAIKVQYETLKGLQNGNM